MAPSLFVAGLTAVVLALYGLAGPWWALLTLGGILVALAVLTERAGAEEPDAPAEADSR